MPTVTPTDLATIVFTSGTTGAPKAVPLSHANLLANVLALAATRVVGPGDRALLPLPLYHIYPLTIGMITPLALGCGIVLPAGISGPEFVAAMRRGRVTALVGVPRLYTALLDNVRHGIAARPRPIAALVRTLLALAYWAQRHGTNWPGKVLLRSMRQQLAPHLRLLDRRRRRGIVDVRRRRPDRGAGESDAGGQRRQISTKCGGSQIEYPHSLLRL